MKAEFVKRGDLYGTEENGLLYVRYGSHKPYPVGDSLLLGIRREILPDLIAVLRALEEAK